METLRWGDYDPAKRVLTIVGFSGWDQKYMTGIWTEVAGDPLWVFLLFMARMGNARYEFHFSEDFKEAEIIPKGNPLVFCCICLPCVPAWLPLPSWITRNTMVQAETSVNGDEWNRYRSGEGH